jgi:GATA-binding protein, other eukaryote
VAAHLEQGQRLENLSWRLWHLQNLMVDTDSAKSKREFKKLSKSMGERLDKEKNRYVCRRLDLVLLLNSVISLSFRGYSSNIEELQAPDFKRSESSDKLKKRAEEKERRGGMKGMQYTFPADPTTNRTPGAITMNAPKKPHKPAHHHQPKSEADDSMDVSNGVTTDLVIDTSFSSLNDQANNASTPTSSSTREPLPSSESIGRGSRGHYRNPQSASISSVSSDIYQTNFPTPTSPELGPTFNTATLNGAGAQQQQVQLHQQQHATVLRFPSLFSSDFGPTALLCAPPSITPNLTYGEVVDALNNAKDSPFGITRPTFEYPIDELMNADAGSDNDTSTTGWNDDRSSALTNSVSSLSIPTPLSASISMASFSALHIGSNNNDAMQGVQRTSPPLTQLRYPSSSSHNSNSADADLDGDEIKPPSPPLVPSQSAPASPAMFATTANPNVFQQADVFPPPLSLPKGSILPGPSPSPSPAPAPAHHKIPRRYSTTNAPPPLETKKSGRQLSATAPRAMRAMYGNSAPGGVKSECANCGANSTPLWRR